VKNILKNNHNHTSKYSLNIFKKQEKKIPSSILNFLNTTLIIIIIIKKLPSISYIYKGHHPFLIIIKKMQFIFSKGTSFSEREREREEFHNYNLIASGPLLKNLDLIII
jgi:hypothetical protein